MLSISTTRTNGQEIKQLAIYDMTLRQIRLSWLNEFLTIDKFAAYYGISPKQAEDLVNASREIEV
jgi:hypothetical protein